MSTAMTRLLEALDDAGIHAYGSHYPTTGTVQLTLKGDAERIDGLFDRWFDTLITSEDLEEEQ